jgi:hypothetical protein
MKRFVWSLILGLFIIPSFVGAQSLDVSITGTPLQPRANETVHLELVSYEADLTQASIVWQYSGKVFDSGVGRTRATVVAPASGQSAVVTAVVSGLSFTPTSVSYVLRPGSVDLLWEAPDSYTPPFYKGRALPATNATIRVYAVPIFNAPRQISYQWSQNGSIIPAASGYAKSSFQFKNSELNDSERIEVVASGDLTSSLSLIMRNPTLLAYKRNDGFIDYANGSTNTLVSDTPGLHVRFEPYNFSVPSGISSDLGFELSIDDSVIYGDTAPNEIRLTKPDNGGNTDIQVAVTTVKYTLQHIEKLFTVVFN